MQIKMPTQNMYIKYRALELGTGFSMGDKNAHQEYMKYRALELGTLIPVQRSDCPPRIYEILGTGFGHWIQYGDYECPLKMYMKY